MTDNSDIIKQLTDKIDMLLEKHEMFSKEISDLRDEIYNLKALEKETIKKQICLNLFPKDYSAMKPMQKELLQL